MFEALIQRTLEGLTQFNTLALPIVRIRFQIAPGTGTGLGINGVPFVVLVGSTPLHAGTTDPIPFIAGGGCILRIFDSDFPLDFSPALNAVTSTIGQLQRMDQMGYVTGYQLLDDIEPSTGAVRNTERSRQCCLNLQADAGISIDDILGPNTRTQLTTRAGM